MEVILHQVFERQRNTKTDKWTVKVVSPGETRGAFVDTSLQLSCNSKAKDQRKAFLRGVNLGKVNERSPLRMAMLHAGMLIKKKQEQGYVETFK